MSPTMPTSNTLSARLLDLTSPLQLLLYSLLYLPITILSHPTLLLTNPHKFQSLWFGALWKFLGPQMALSPEQTPYIAGLFTRAQGTVLELGPGNGDQMRHLVNAVREGRVERVVGAEPNAALHERLLGNARGVGLNPGQGKYVVLEAGAEPGSLIPALHRVGMYPSSSSSAGAGAAEGIFDTIICIKSMCSAPQHQMPEIVSTIHALLKPGGEFLFFEHVANDNDLLTRVWAWLLGWIWPIAMGNCHLNGRVDKAVKESGLFESCDVRNTKEFMGWNVFRYVVGVCRK
ncbi:hypothetical protein LTR05_006806 [Lithohypha guttulata]|uniref:S-adenosyl-L-methionine-dependent methyltransferase n=1 Tax=Lithohypha guttulata TaxID=1690604 RepID=A0AAN7Y554_9EURO|nr:hypothetical protein LTR05_006806 [Lithohypha guttulata]